MSVPPCLNDTSSLNTEAYKGSSSVLSLVNIVRPLLANPSGYSIITCLPIHSVHCALRVFHQPSRKKKKKKEKKLACYMVESPGLALLVLPYLATPSSVSSGPYN